MTEKLEALRKLLETKQRVRHSVDELGGKIGTNYYEPDPAYDPLREVLYERDCPDYCARVGAYGEQCEEGKPPNPLCHQCHGLGYVARSWDKMPPGALAGALEEAGDLCGFQLEWNLDTTFGSFYTVFNRSRTGSRLREYRPTLSRDEAALQAITEMLEARK